MVGGEHDQRVLHQARAFHVIEQASQMVVQLPDQALVGRTHHAHAIVAGKTDALLVLPIGGHHRMRILQLGKVAAHGQALVRAVAPMVGIRCHVGPVRLHIAQMQHPGLAAAPLHEVQRLVRHVGGLGMRLGHARRQMHIAHVPAADHLPGRVHAGDDVVGPGIGAVVAVTPQEGRIAALGPGFMVTVVAVQLDEAAPVQQDAQFRRAVDGKPLHARLVRYHVGLAGQRQVAPLAGQVFAQRDLVDRKRHAVPGRAVARWIAAGGSSCATDRTPRN